MSPFVKFCFYRGHQVFKIDALFRDYRTWIDGWLISRAVSRDNPIVA